jgi:hypothetical protein
MIDTDNVIPIRKSDRFFLCKGHFNEAGQFIETERVGVAYLKPSSTTFRLRLWTFPKHEYFLARVAGDHSRYLALCREEIAGKSYWHKIGSGEVIGSFIRIGFHLLPDDIYLCLFPGRTAFEEVDHAA